MAQETWLRFASAPHVGGPLRPRLVRILRGLGRNGWREQARRGRRERPAARAEALPFADELLQRLELTEPLARAVARLPEPTRPPLAAERLTLTARGRVRYESRRPSVASGVTQCGTHTQVHGCGWRIPGFHGILGTLSLGWCLTSASPWDWQSP